MITVHRNIPNEAFGWSSEDSEITYGELPRIASCEDETMISLSFPFPAGVQA